MPVVAARVHLAREPAAEREAGLLLDVDGVHVGPEAQDGPLAPDLRYQAGFQRAQSVSDAGGLEGLGHQLGGLHLFEAQLWMGMDVALKSYDHLPVVGYAALYRLCPGPSLH